MDKKEIEVQRKSLRSVIQPLYKEKYFLNRRKDEWFLNIRVSDAIIEIISKEKYEELLIIIPFLINIYFPHIKFYMRNEHYDA